MLHFDASLAPASETMGLSLFAGAGTVFPHHVAGSKVEKHVDKVADRAIDTVPKAAHKVMRAFFCSIVHNLDGMYRCHQRHRFDEMVDELQVEGDLRVGRDIMIHGQFPKMEQKMDIASN